MEGQIKRLNTALEGSRDSLLKLAQYAAIFTAWWHQSNDNQPGFERFFTLYLQFFRSRRLYRIFQSTVLLPTLIDLVRTLRGQFSFEGLFRALRWLNHNHVDNLGHFLFFLSDNATIILMLLGSSKYRIVRRVSYTILFGAIVFEFVVVCIKLRKSFDEEYAIRSHLESISPQDFLESLSKIDCARKTIAIEFCKMIGDLLPTLARTNLPEILVRTKINKGTVGVFGMVAAAAQLILSQNEGRIWV